MPDVSASSSVLERVQRLTGALQSSGLGGLVLNPGPSLTYFTGLSFHLSERPTCAFFCADGRAMLILAELEQPKLALTPVNFQPFTFNDNPASWLQAFQAALAFGGLQSARLGVEPVRLRYLELDLLQRASPSVSLVSGAEVIASLRMRKDAAEVAAMRSAVQIAEQALEATLPAIRPGVSERELAAELTLQLLRHGSEPEMPFAPIMASGPNSANPHATPTDRKLQTGDLLVIDWGAAYQGYFSDLTRTFAIGQVEPELARIAAIVAEANAAGRAAIRPGVEAGSLDAAARKVIEQAGYGQYFTHRVGHGLGMEGHEAPYLFGANEEALATAMTFTIEPGIYLPGRGGVRIEDDMVVTAEGGESLSSYPRALRVLE